jgi:hypothetical protein
MSIVDVKTECTAMYTLLSTYLTEVAAGDGYEYFETNAATITIDLIEQTRKILKEAVDAAGASPDESPAIWDLVTLCNAAVQDTLSLIDAKNQVNKNPDVVPSTGTIRWLINTTTKR